jgi:hypothetical protein
MIDISWKLNLRWRCAFITASFAAHLRRGVNILAGCTWFLRGHGVKTFQLDAAQAYQSMVVLQSPLEESTSALKIGFGLYFSDQDNPTHPRRS